jgi:hypothetical protein
MAGAVDAVHEGVAVLGDVRHEDRCQSCLDELVKAEEEAGRIYPIYICDYHQMEMGV